MLAEGWKLLYNIEAKILKRVGSGISGRVYFEATSPKPLTTEQLQQLQMDLGYHPSGYGFFITNLPVYIGAGVYAYTWSCSTSCD